MNDLTRLSRIVAYTTLRISSVPHLIPLRYSAYKLLALPGANYLEDW